MNESSLSHQQDVVSRIVDGDPDRAELLFELLVLTDASTPIGAAAHAGALQQCYADTPEFYVACREKESKLKAVAASL